MPRGMDDTFHRLLWITLVAVAFTFTVILTSVFVDIDDLLLKRSSPVMKQQTVTESTETNFPTGFVGDYQGFPSNEEDSDENESTFRTKRSLETNNYLHHVKSPKMKKFLTSRLATLLEELDEEDSSKDKHAEGAAGNLKDNRGFAFSSEGQSPKHIVNPNHLSTEETIQKKESTLDIIDTNYDKLKNDIDHKDILHLAMHNILLQGIKEHLDLNDVYRKVHLLIKSFESKPNRDAKETSEFRLKESKPMELMKIIAHDSYKQEDKFFNELINCEKLQKQILQISEYKPADKTEAEKDSHMLIKTTIEITNNNKGKENFINPNENTTGIVKLVYNGKEVKSVDIIDDKNIETVQNTHSEENQHNTESFNKKLNSEWQQMRESALDQAIADYLKTHSVKFHNKYNVMSKGSFVTKRLKRQVKIRYLDDRHTTEKSKQSKQKSKLQDDELYVEIETHFDGKGSKGEKKKKLVRTLIDKIQRAINSNVEGFNQEKTVKQKHLQIKKRIQNPIDRNELIISTKSPKDVVEHRQLNPISKTSNVIQPLTSVLGKSGDTWKKVYKGPGFLAASKSLNSAEMRELDIDYNSVMKNGIPKRLQKPINTENEDLNKPNEYTDMGNVTLFLKDINGSGFSIGINQYTDEPPDKEALKMFTGLENLIQAYHEHYDQTEAVSNESEERTHYITDASHEIKKRDVNKEWLATGRIKNREQSQENTPFLTESNQRKHSGINVKLFSNIKTKTKLNKFLNTNAMLTKKIFRKSQRNKRQIDKIRIVASDRYPSTSREKIFLVSRENTYADRAIVKEDETPEVAIGDRNDERYDFIEPYNIDFPNYKPAYLSNTYDTKPLHSGLMSKYPHIFVENISKSKEFYNISPRNAIEDTIYGKGNAETIMHSINADNSNEKNTSSSNVDEIVNAILPSRNNFKIVLKIFPKNKTSMGPGFKEVHTLINKSFDKNGLRYISSLNVSEVSKFESLNKTKEEVIPIINNEMERRQNQIKVLLELHKERIDQQLRHLKIERQKLNEMIGYENSIKNASHLTNVFSQLGNHFHFNNNNANIHSTTSINTLIPQSETTTIPLFTTTNKQQDSDKVKILSSIKENENITRQILQKIDNNTNILHVLLRKIVNEKSSTPKVDVNTEKMLFNNTSKYLIDNQVIHPLLEQLHSNFSNAVPFIYAFQHPFIENRDKATKTVANIVYHGHIHANKLTREGKKNDLIKNPTNNLKIESYKKINKGGINDNETKFFIDDLENDFKLVSNVNDRIPVLTPIKSNVTNN